jgi:hypothetical protein
VVTSPELSASAREEISLNLWEKLPSCCWFLPSFLALAALVLPGAGLLGDDHLQVAGFPDFGDSTERKAKGPWSCTSWGLTRRLPWPGDQKVFRLFIDPDRYCQ